MGVAETGNEIVVKAGLPGVGANAVAVAAQDNVLTVRGERKGEREAGENNYHRVERLAGTFYRAIALPPGADPNNVDATSASGVGTIAAPRKAVVQPR